MSEKNGRTLLTTLIMIILVLLIFIFTNTQLLLAAAREERTEIERRVDNIEYGYAEITTKLYYIHRDILDIKRGVQ